MYRLYLISTNSKLDESPEEYDIIDTIGRLLQKSPNMQFRIIKNHIIDGQDTDEIYRYVKSPQDYQCYLEEYRIRKASIEQLKRGMFGINDKTLYKKWRVNNGEETKNR